MIKYRVLVNDEWVDADYGIQITNDRLAFWIGSHRGITKRGQYRIHPDTLNCPRFKKACAEKPKHSPDDIKQEKKIDKQMRNLQLA